MGWQDMPVIGAEPQAPKTAKWQNMPEVGASAELPSYDPEKSASLRATAVASLASDPAQRIPYYARERGIPENRFKVVGPKVAYQADDGQWYYEESPNFFPRSATEGAQQLAGAVGGAIPTLAGTLTGIASAPLVFAGPAGLGAAVAATGGAAAAGEATRQALASEFVSPAAPDRGKILAEGVTAGLGQGIGAGLTAIEQRVVAPELQRLGPKMADNISKAASELEAKARALGIELTPAESTNLASLKAQQKLLGNMPQSADDMAAFYERRQSEQVAPAVRNFMDGVSTESSPVVAGTRIREAASDAIEAAKQVRTSEVRPLYQAVVKRENVVPVTVGGVREAGTSASRTPMGKLMDDPFFSQQVAGVKGNSLYGMADMEDTALPVLDQVKKNLDDMIEVAKRGGERNKVRLLEKRRSSLLKATDEAFPDYAIARTAFEAKTPEVEELANSVLGVVSKLKDTSAKKAAGVLFSDTSSSPEQIAIARRTLEKRDPEAWRAIKRSWLQIQWARAGREPVSGNVVNQGAKWRQLLLGDDTRKANMKAALDPKEYAALQDLADVLEATGRVKPIGSDTAWNQEMQKLARERATPTWARITGNAISPTQWGTLVKDWATERGLKKHAAELVQIIQQPDARELLKELKLVSPQSAKFKAGVGHLLTRSVTSSTGRTAPTQEDRQ